MMILQGRPAVYFKVTSCLEIATVRLHGFTISITLVLFDYFPSEDVTQMSRQYDGKTNTAIVCRSNPVESS